MDKKFYLAGTLVAIILFGMFFVSGGKTEDTCSVDIYASEPGTTQPGMCCKTDNQCWSSDCGCQRGGSKANRCCHLDNGKECNNDAECQSSNCGNNGKCKDNTATKDNNRPNGDSCSVNQDCKSGLCATNKTGRACTAKPSKKTPHFWKSPIWKKWKWWPFSSKISEVPH